MLPDQAPSAEVLVSPAAQAAASRGPRATIRLCGPLEVELDGRRVETVLPGRQARLVLAYLVVHRDRPVGRDELMELLWPEQPPASPEASFRVLLVHLRQALGPGVLDGRGQLELRLGRDAWVDVEAASRARDLAETTLDAGDAITALAAAREALEILSRPLLGDLTSPWLDDRRRELDELRIPLLELAVRAGLRLGGRELGVAERAARDLIAREPYRESGYALLMEALAAGGNVVEALRVYESLRVLLRDELGVVPAPAVAALHARLLRQEDADPLEPAAPGPGPAAQGPGVSLPTPLRAVGRDPFVGRAEPIRRLDALWRRVQAGERRFVLVVGEPGVGKTRIASRVAQAAHASGGTVLYGRADEDMLAPYQPFVEALHHHVSQTPLSELEVSLGAELSELGRLIPELSRHMPELREPLLGDAETQRFRLFETVVRLLAHAASRRPLLLVLDDLHWADRTTLQLLRHVLRAPAPTRLMVLGTYRDVEVVPSHHLAELLADLRREQLFDRVALAGLDETETAALVSSRLDAEAAPAFVERLHRQTAGNPFFIGEALRSLAESGSPAHDRSDDQEQALERMGVPEGVGEVIVRRLSRLSELTVWVLSAASAIGREFDLGVLAATLQVDEDELIAGLEEAMGAGLVLELPDGADRFAFCHALVRQTLYERQAVARRVRLHRRIAEALEGRADERGGSVAELAHHFFEARQVAGPEKAIRYAVQAGEQAAAALAHQEAVDHLHRALRAFGPGRAGDGAQRCEVLLRLGRVQWRAGDSAAARATFSQAVVSARGRDAPEQLARAALGVTGHYYEAGVADPSVVALLEEALAALGEQDGALRARLLTRLADSLHFQAAAERSEALSLQAVAMAKRVGDTDALVAALTARHAALLHVARLDERLRVSDEALDLAERVGNRELTAQALHWRVYDLLELGDAEAARRDHGALRRLADELGQPIYAHFTAAWDAVWAHADGRFEESEALAGGAQALAERAQLKTARSTYLGQLFSLRRDQGRLGELVDGIETVAARYPAFVVWRAALPVALIGAGRETDARAAFERLAADDFAAIPRDLFWLSTFALLTDACAGLGDGPRADALYDRLAPYEHRTVQVSLAACWGSAARYLGLLAATGSRAELAPGHFATALAGNARLGARPALARTQAEYADVLRARGEAGDAARARELRDAARELGAPNERPTMRQRPPGTL